MKKICNIAVSIGVLTVLHLCLVSCDKASGAQNGNKEEEENVIAGSFARQENTVKAFLLENLESGTGRYRADAILTRDSIDMARSLVWKAWKKANVSFDEEKLSGLPQFGDQSVDLFTWNIPKSLEGEYLGNGQYSGKDAQMKFHWGSCGSKPEGGYPVFVYLHGSGPVSNEWSNGYGFCKKWGQSTAGIYFVPKIPNGVTEQSGFSLYRWWQKGKQYIWNRLIRQLFISSYADPDRFFFVGISEGAYGSARLSTFYADYLAGIGPIAGGEPLNTAPVENSANIAYCLRTGSEDAGYGRNTITKYTGEALDALEKAHPGYYDHWVYLEPGAYHGSVDYNQAVPWLNGKVRKHYPKYVNWERLDQDGIYREGFYNLFIPDGGHPSDRRQYEMTISGNVVKIKVGTVSYTGIEEDKVYKNYVKYERSYKTVSGGKIRIYLCDELLDLDQPVVVKVNGKEVFSGMLERKFEDMVNSCAIYFDPSRLYTASVEVSY